MSEISTSFVVIAVILSTIVVGTFVGNFFVITAILVDKNLQTTANQLVLSLAVADLMVACLVMPLGAYNDIHQGWYLGKEVCEFWTSADVLCCTASILNLLAIALDRYWAVTSVDYIYRRTRRRVNMMILYAWTVGAIVSLAPMFGWKDPEFAKRVLENHTCMVSQDVAYQIFATISTFYAPLVLLLALYWRIFQVARKRIRRKPGQNNNNNQQQQRQKLLAAPSTVAPPSTEIVRLSGQLESQAAPNSLVGSANTPACCSNGAGSACLLSQRGDQVVIGGTGVNGSSQLLVSEDCFRARSPLAISLAPAREAAASRAGVQVGTEAAGSGEARAGRQQTAATNASSNYGADKPAQTALSSVRVVCGTKPEQSASQGLPAKHRSTAERLLRLASCALIGERASFRRDGWRQSGLERAQSTKVQQSEPTVPVSNGGRSNNEAALNEREQHKERDEEPTRNRLPLVVESASRAAPAAASVCELESQPDGRRPPFASEQREEAEQRANQPPSAGSLSAESEAEKMNYTENNEPPELKLAASRPAILMVARRRWGRRVAPEPIGPQAAELRPGQALKASANLDASSSGSNSCRRNKAKHADRLPQFRGLRLSTSGECCCCCDTCRLECERCTNEAENEKAPTAERAAKQVQARQEEEGGRSEGRSQINYERVDGRDWSGAGPGEGAYLARNLQPHWRRPDKSKDKDDNGAAAATLAAWPQNRPPEQPDRQQEQRLQDKGGGATSAFTSRLAAAMHLSGGRAASCDWSPSNSASIASVSNSASGCSRSSSSASSSPSSSATSFDRADRLEGAEYTNIESASSTATGDFHQLQARRSRPNCYDRGHQHHFCARIENIGDTGAVDGCHNAQRAQLENEEDEEGEELEEDDDDEQSDASSFSASFPPPIELSRAKDNRQKSKKLETVDSAGAFKLVSLLSAASTFCPSSPSPSPPARALAGAGAGANSSPLNGTESEQPPERSTVAGIARASRRGANLGSGGISGGSSISANSNERYVEGGGGEDSVRDGEAAERLLWRRNEVAAGGGRRMAPMRDLGEPARKYNGISTASTRPLCLASPPVLSLSPQPPDDKLSHPQRIYWLARSNNVTGFFAASEPSTATTAGDYGSCASTTTSTTSSLAPPTTDCSAACADSGEAAAAIAARSQQQKRAQPPTTAQKAAKRQLHFQQEKQLNSGHQEGFAAKISPSGADSKLQAPVSAASGSQQAFCELAGNTSSRLMRSLDIRRKFRALGQLVSFVQTSRNLSNSGSSSAPSSQSGEDDCARDDRDHHQRLRVRLDHPGKPYCVSDCSTTTSSPMTTTNGHLDFSQQEQQPVATGKERDIEPDFRDGSHNYGERNHAAGENDSNVEGGRTGQQHGSARVHMANRAHRASRADGQQQQFQVSASPELDTPKSSCLLSAGRLAANANTNESASAVASSTSQSQSLLSPPLQLLENPAAAKLPLNRQVDAAPTPQVAPVGKQNNSQALRRQDMDIKREKKAAKTLAIITGVFVCCWLPFFLNAIIMSICGKSCTPSDLILSVLLWLGYLNSLLNPIIYTIFSPDFRRAFRRLLCWPQLVSFGARFKASNGPGQPGALVACVGGGGCSGSLARQA